MYFSCVAIVVCLLCLLGFVRLNGGPTHLIRSFDCLGFLVDLCLLCLFLFNGA